ncbi:MAG TPA: class I SAM-dependent methyltransferase [Candidatus Limnocylindria bacterium]|nr:class I SAM-dependent methyltransferase [Candidatus Limnocylindria bacterium]
MNAFLCRSCGSTHGRLVLDLGVQPLANNLLTEADLARPEPRFPLRVALCEACWLLQITDIVPPVELFSEYLYFSSFSDALLRHAAESVTQHRHSGALGPASFVVEIASNDGYLLKNFVAAGIPCLGIEPAVNIAKVALERGVPTVSRFFGREVAAELAQQGRQADLILGNNVFAHAPDTNDFVAGLATLLKSGGRIALEFPYACDLIEHVEFDTIYHEHVFYFTLTALQPLFARHGLELFDVERLTIHGGSLRLYAAHRGTQGVRPAVTTLLAEEQAKGVASPRYYDDFGDRVRRIRDDLVTLVRRLKGESKSIAAYGASAKGSTLLNYYGLGRETLDFVADRSTAKQGRLTPGTHLPIVAAEELARRRPDFALLLTWNFAEEILKQQQAYQDLGGKFIVPLPEVQTI